MMNYCRVGLLILFTAYLNPAFTLEQSDKVEIQQIIQNYVDAWNYREGKGFGDGFTEDADFVNIFGMNFSGKAEIEDRHIKILQTILKGSKFELMNLNLREVQPGLVIALVRWKVEGFRNPCYDINKSGETREGIFTQVFINQNNKWQITASQNTLVPNQQN